MLAVELCFFGGTYEAALDAGPEWPPHPGRLFSALVAHADPGSPDDEALTWLQAQPPPVVLVSPARPSTSQAFVPTNLVGTADTHQTYLGRTSGARSWHRMHPRSATVRMLWEDAEPSASVRRSLGRLCRQVPYLGRATSPVTITLADAVGDMGGLARFESPGDRSVRLRVPGPGSLADLRAAYETGESARSVDRWLPYGQPVVAPDDAQEAVVGPWAELLTFGLPTGVALDGRQVLRIATAFRSSLLSALGRTHTESELALLHGHRSETGRQCAFLPLPSVGDRHADGQVRGLALALSPDLPADVRRSTLRVMGLDIDAPRLEGFFVPGLLDRPQPLRHGDLDGRSVVAPRRWVGGVDGRRTWATVSPIVPDRYPHRGEALSDHVARACAFAGYPDPHAVEVLPTSMLRGAAHLRRDDLRRRRTDAHRPAVHCRITFSAPVRGPVVLGNLRHLGVGLCLPVVDVTAGEPGPAGAAS
jgi:CRISPR-associated protein Csb2